MNLIETKYPTFTRWFRMLRRFFRWLFSWRMIRRALLGFAALVTLIVVYFTWEKWRGNRDWNEYQQQMEAKGIPMHMTQIIPPPVPDDQNFALTPLLKPLFPHYQTSQEQLLNKYPAELNERLKWPMAPGNDPNSAPSLLGYGQVKSIDLKPWQEYFGTPDILQALKKFDPILDEISAASRRPSARFSIPYEFGLTTFLPHLGVLMQLGRIYELRALAELAQGQSDQAATDAVTIIRLSNALSNDSTLISARISTFIAGMGIEVVGEGSTARRWSDAQLAELQGELNKLDFLTTGKRALDSDRVFFSENLGAVIGAPKGLETLASHLMADPDGRNSSHVFYPNEFIVLMDDCLVFGFPDGWLKQNLLIYNRYMQTVASAYDPEHHHVDPDRENQVGQYQWRRTIFPYRILVTMLAPGLGWSYVQSAARAQTEIDEAGIACAIERYRLANGKLPDNLEALKPRFMAKLPNDIISGQPLIYRRPDDDQYILYSVGWNNKDDGGKIVREADGQPEPDFAQPDWVWTYAQK